MIYKTKVHVLGVEELYAILIIASKELLYSTFHSSFGQPSNPSLFYLSIYYGFPLSLFSTT